MPPFTTQGAKRVLGRYGTRARATVVRSGDRTGQDGSCRTRSNRPTATGKAATHRTTLSPSTTSAVRAHQTERQPLPRETAAATTADAAAASPPSDHHSQLPERPWRPATSTAVTARAA